VKALLATPGRFHSFALARELEAHSALHRIVTGFPWIKVARERLPRRYVHTAPAAQLLNSALNRLRLSNEKINQRLLLETLHRVDRLSLRLIEEADVFVALSGAGTETGFAMRQLGKAYVCDRGSSHILYQQKVLAEECDLNRAPRPYFNPRIIERELREYETSTAITVPSQFAENSFRQFGFPSNKVRRISYGVNLSNFQKCATPDPARFEVLFVGSLCLRKGVPYLLKAFGEFKHPHKRLTLVGIQTPETVHFLKAMTGDAIGVLGHVPHLKMKEIMSASHVMVLPSVEEGLALVMGEALACGCPVIATENTGARDLFEDGKEGFILPIRDPTAIREKLEFMADNPGRRDEMSRAALARVASLSGWKQYGDRYYGLLSELIERS
jgi:starch synthase